MGVSGNLWILVKDVKTLVVYDVESETTMDSMKGNSRWILYMEPPGKSIVKA